MKRKRRKRVFSMTILIAKQTKFPPLFSDLLFAFIMSRQNPKHPTKTGSPDSVQRLDAPDGYIQKYPLNPTASTRQKSSNYPATVNNFGFSTKSKTR